MSDRLSSIENDADIAAAHWLARIDRLGPSEAFNPDLQAWLGQDPRHRGAFERAKAGWALFDEAATAPNVRLESRPVPKRRLMDRRAFIGGGAVAAGLGIAVISMPAPARAYTTEVGEILRITLADGFSVTLDTDSTILARSSDARSSIELVRGGLLLEASKIDYGFRVETSDYDAEGERGRFYIARAPAAEVIVANGALVLRSTKRGLSRTLTTGGRAVVSASGDMAISQLGDDEIDRALAWREGGISLDGETVAEAAQMFNRYNQRTIVVADAWLAQQHIVGWFAVDQPGTFAEAVAEAFSGDVVENSQAIRISRR